MDCFPDFCLACDNQTTDGLYCSQACRLADLEKAGSAPESPITPTSYSFANLSWTNSHSGTASAFFLPPALDFGTFRPRSGQQSASSTPRKEHLYHTSHHHRSPQPQSTSNVATPQRMLSPSSSHSSLTSALSGLTTHTAEGLSEQAKTELREYVNSFDQTREWRRQSNPCLKHRSSISQTNELLTSTWED